MVGTGSFKARRKVTKRRRKKARADPPCRFDTSIGGFQLDKVFNYG
jgi:hypothetical protein